MGLRTLFGLKKKKKQNISIKKEILSDDSLAELWTQCPMCKTMLYTEELKKNFSICNKCSYHFRISAQERINMLIDPDSWEENNEFIITSDPLKFSDLKSYPDKIKKAKKISEENEAIVTGTGNINSQKVAMAIMEFKFLGGSMGSVVGEKIVRLCELAEEKLLPLIIISSSGGARMHEGLFSLLQMAKTASALEKLQEKNLLFISFLTDPTYGGVSASFATLGDIIISEPGAKIGFAGPRVIQETIRQKLPKNFQTSEYLLEHGQIDLVISRDKLKDKLSLLLEMHS